MMEECRKSRVDMAVKSTKEFLVRQLTDKRVDVPKCKTEFHMIHNFKPLCLSQWLHLYGFTTQSKSVQRAIATVLDGKFAHKGPGKRQNMCNQSEIATRWCVAYLKTRLGDMSPVTGKHMIVRPKTRVWHNIFKSETSSTISIDRFGTALNAAYNDAEFRDPETKKKRIEVRERDSFTECQVCSDLQLQMGLAKTTSAFVHAKEQFDSHNASQKAEREVYYRHRDNAKKHPNKYMCLIIDGMDQFKLKLPQYEQNTKDNTTQLDTKLTGIKVHGVGTYFYFTSGTFKAGANLNIDCLNQTLLDLRRIYDELIEKGELEKWPDKLYIQVDGGSENMNRFFLAYCDRLVAFGLFEKVKVNFLMVGHTHEDIDQIFSVVAGTLKEENCLSLDQMMDKLSKLDLNEPRHPKCKLLHSVWDWKYWFVGGYLKDDVEPGEDYMTEALAKHINMIKQFTTYHVFRFAKCYNEVDVFIKGKEWGRKDMTYPWEPDEDNPLLLG